MARQPLRVPFIQPRNPGATDRRFGTAQRDPVTGRVMPGEVNNFGLPMGARPAPTGASGVPVSGAFSPLRQVANSPATANQAGAAPVPTPAIPIPGAALANPFASAGSQALQTGLAPAASPVPVASTGAAVAPAGPLSRIADGGYGRVTNMQTPSDAFGAAPVQPAGQPYNPGKFETPGIHNHTVQSGGDLFASMEATHPGFAQMSPADKANVFRSMAGQQPVTAAPTMPAAGQTVQTPYGTVSGPPDYQTRNGAMEGPTQDGTSLDWQHEVVNAYPRMGVAGTPENAAFVRAYQQHNDPSQAMATAHSVMGNNPDGTPMPKLQPQGGDPNSPDYAFTPQGPAPSPGEAGAAARQKYVTGPLTALGTGVEGALAGVGNAYQAVKGFFGGSTPSEPYTSKDVDSALTPYLAPSSAPSPAVKSPPDQIADTRGATSSPLTNLAKAGPQSPDDFSLGNIGY